MKRIVRLCAWFMVTILTISCIAESGIGTINVQAQRAGVVEEDGNCVLALGDANSAVVKSDGSLWQWGFLKSDSEGFPQESYIPVKTMSGVRDIAIGGDLMWAVIKEDSSLWTWGTGWLGDGSYESTWNATYIPRKIASNVKQVALATFHGAFIKEDGSLWMWGRGIDGELGNGSGVESSTPQKLLSNVKTVALAESNSAAITEDGSLWMWGNNDYGQLGNGTTIGSKTPIKVLEDVREVAIADDFWSNQFSAAIKEDGSLWMWGSNDYGQLGNGTTDSSYEPVKVMDNVKSVSLGGGHSAAIKEDGSLWMWGKNSSGQVGNKSNTDCYEPEKIIENVLCVSLGDGHSAAIKEDGSLWMWGSNGNGQLGNGQVLESVDSNTEPFELMPKGSIAVPEVERTITFPISVELLSDPSIKVVDIGGQPLSGVTVSYRGEDYTTLADGLVTLPNYIQGQSLEIRKDNFETKIIDSYICGTAGCDTYTLCKAGSAIKDVTMIVNNKKTDLLTQEATINCYYKTTNFSIDCKGNSQAVFYELYSGDEKIAVSNEGSFNELKYADFHVGKDVVLKVLTSSREVLQEKKLNIKVINVNPQMLSLSVGNGFSIKIPKGTPIVGGMNFDLKLESIPVTVEMDGDKMKFGFNVTQIVKNEPKTWFSTVKQLNKKNCTSFFNAMKKAKKKVRKEDFDSGLQIVGWAEGNIKNPDYFSGKLIAEFEASAYEENQIFPFGIPVVIEVSVEGKVNADGSITFTSAEGLSGGLSVGGEIATGLYGGVGIAKFASAGIYGKAGLGLKYDILPEVVRGLNELYIKGEAGVKVKAFGKNLGKLALINGTYYIINNDTAHAVNSLNNVPMETLYIDNNTVYADVDRSYLCENGSVSIHWSAEDQAYANGSVSETVLQDSTYLDIIPQVIVTDDSAMLFYLTDGGSARADADRSQLVYSVYNEMDGSWTTPEAVMEDGTADFAPDIFTDGEKVYVVWQNATESLEGKLTLNDIADRLMLQTAVYDEATGGFTDLGSIDSENDLLQHRPQIVSDGEEIFVYWYENATDNVLGLSGENRIYQAVLSENTVTKATADMEAEAVYEEESSTAEEAQETEEQTEEDSEEVEETEIETDIGEEENSESEENSEPEESEPVSEEESEEPEEIVAENTEDFILHSMTSKDTVSGNDIMETEESEESETEESLESEEESESDEEQSTEESTSDVEESESVEGSTEEELETSAVVANKSNGNITQTWLLKELKEEPKCIVSADAGYMDGEVVYAYAAGTLDKSYNVTESSVMLLAQNESAKNLVTGTPENLEFTNIFGKETLTWYENGDICYLTEDGTISAFFEEGRLPSANYALLSDAVGNPEVIFPINAEGKSDLYRIGYENGAFMNTLAVTNQDDYIQYVDGFIDGDETILVYNQMEVDENLEEVNNSLRTGTLEHSYYDIVAQSAGSMIKEDTETGEDVLEITAQIYNNGTIKAEGLTLQLAKADGAILESVAVDTVIEAGETGFGTAEISLDNITEEADYTITVIGEAESNSANNSTTITLGEAKLQMAAEVVAVGDTRTLQIGVKNTGVAACGGTVKVQDTETGVEYCASEFEAISRGSMIHVEVPVDTTIFEGREFLSLEVTVVSENEGDVISEPVVVYAPTYIVCFVTDAGEENEYISYGNRAIFPANPIKEDARFIGWYTSETPAEGVLYTEETEITEDVTLYACFATEEEAKMISLEKCSVSLIPTQNYTGKALKPAVTVKWGSTILNPKKDYTVSYSNNINQGTATVTITGKGNYTGSITRTFDIKYPLSKVSIKKLPAVDYTGEQHTPDVTVIYKGKTLKKNKDYTITYTNNRNAGTAGVTITGKGKYTGTKSTTFQIKGISIAGMKFDKLANVVYSGSSEEPFVTVKTKAGVQLRNGADYKTVYTNSVNKGTATVTIIGNGNYTGTKKLTYKILAKPLAKGMISEVEAQIYTGASLKPNVTVTDGDKTLVLGKDYTISYSKNKHAGTATATVTGKGNYGGKIAVPFVINKENLENNENVTVKVSDVAYTGRNLKPTVQVYVGNKKLSTKDYAVTYSNNKELGSGTVTVTGKGNYTGSVSENFRIVKKASLVSSLKYGKLGSYEYTGGAIEPEVSIMDGEYRLVENTDYTLTYNRQINAGTASVTVNGIGNYAGSKTLTYKITQRVMVSKNVWKDGFTIEEIEGQKYTGYALKPDVVLKDGDKLLEKGKDYKLSYKSNTNIGTGKITVTGIGNYKGSNSAVTFPIVAWEYDNLEAMAVDQIYTGKALSPKVTFMLDGEEIVLKTNTAVKIAYSNNKNAGEATITITGKGNLKDMTPIVINFAIEQADLEKAVVSNISNQTLKATPVKPIPKVKVGKNSLKYGKDFTVSYLRNGIKGEAEVIITGIGNYTGECRKTFIVQ